MIQTHQSVGRLGYQLAPTEYTQSRDTLRKRAGNPTLQPLKMFQFIIGESKFTLILFIEST